VTAATFDAVVVGAGPAGSAAAAALARRGRRVCVLEAERFPRFHIGESLLPLGHRVFAELGVAETLQRAGFVQKRGAQLLTPCGGHRVLFDFEATRVNPPFTHQVHRAEFDDLLLQHAVRAGAELQTARVRDFRIGDDGVEVTHVGADGVERTVRAKALIDASGRAGVVARRQGVRVVDEELRKAAIYAHFRGVAVDDGKRGGDTRIIALPRLGWFWLIPLKDGVMSVGAVLDIADYQGREKGDPARLFAESLAEAPLAARLLAGAERISDFHVESGFSYRSTSYCGDRWFLAGDAGSFLDPIFSTGVLMALQSGVEAAAAVDRGYLQARPDPQRALASYQRTLQSRYWFVRRFVTGFYDAATRDMFFAPRRFLGLARAVTTVLAGGFELGWLDRLRLQVFFLLGRLQKRFDMVPRLSTAAEPAVRERSA